jgi:selenocysteine-specific elongation factor
MMSAGPVQTYPVILGTAGHIDHGKTSLVRALTGIDTDRLKEEQERGITIELGFAHLDVKGRRFGLVDVPGHERFVKAMVAGAAGVDVVMLVIAADEGVMPQTREHLDICQLLGVKRGVVVLSKRDLVDEAWLELVSADVRAALAGTFLEEARVLPVSATTGAGLDELRAHLVQLADAVPPRPADGVFRLPLDRVFSMKGFGTVVTGTILGGRVRAGDDVVALPGGRAAKVRGLQVHGQAVNEARAGMRCAVNLLGVERAELARGEVLVLPGVLEPSHLIDVRFRALSACKAPLGRRTRVLVHHATTQLEAQLVLVDRDELAPGAEGLAQLRLEAPIAAVPGDRFIARGFVPLEHHGTTVGGGEILRVHAPKVRRSSGLAAAAVQRVAEAAPVERVALEVLAGGPGGMSRKELGARLGLLSSAVDAALARLVDARELLRDGNTFLHGEVLAGLEAQVTAALDAFHAAEPHKEGLPREELRGRLPRALPPRLFEAVLGELARRGALVAERDIVRRARHVPATAAASVGPLVEALLARLQSQGLESERPQDLAVALAVPERDLKAALDVALRAGRVVRVRPDYVVARPALDALRDKLRAFLAEHGQITAQEWKALTGATRKYAIPLAEHFDAEKVTLRVGEVRKLRG